MKTLSLPLLLAGFLGATSVLAAVPAGVPAGTSGMCNDGTYSSSAEKKGACRGHKGVKDWYASETASPASPMAPPAPTMTKAPATTTAPVAPAIQKPATMPGGSPMAAAGGGAGKVWANDSTKVYHCTGDKYYGTTKKGEYMAEADAKAKGYHADHGKACS